MGIENIIKNIEKTLKKKKTVMREKLERKIAKLKDRIKAKSEKIEMLLKENEVLENDVADLMISFRLCQNVADVETKPFVPGKDSKDLTVKNPKKK